MNEIRNFVLIDDNGKGGKVFNGCEPQQAVLKVANRIGGTKSKLIRIILRERVTKRFSFIWMERTIACFKD